MTNWESIRTEVLAKCGQILNEKKSLLKNELSILQESLENESKSSAGDKYETGIEMIQVEKEKLMAQLNALEGNFNLVAAAKVRDVKPYVQNGSLVVTNGANYFVGPSLGKISIEDKLVFAISPSSPIAQTLLHKKAGDSVEFNGNKLEISFVA